MLHMLQMYVDVTVLHMMVAHVNIVHITFARIKTGHVAVVHVMVAYVTVSNAMIGHVAIAYAMLVHVVRLLMSELLRLVMFHGCTCWTIAHRTWLRMLRLYMLRLHA